jgi:hypothetical protein
VDDVRNRQAAVEVVVTLLVEPIGRKQRQDLLPLADGLKNRSAAKSSRTAKLLEPPDLVT